MHSPKKKYKVKIKNDSGAGPDQGRFLYYGGNELAAVQDAIGKPAIELFWEMTDLGECATDEARARKMFGLLGDKEMLALLHVGINGGGDREFTVREVGDLIHTDVDAKSGYFKALMGALSMALFGKDQEALEEEAAKRKAEKTEGETEDDEEATPNPT